MSNRVSEDQLNQALAKAGIMEYLIFITFLECLAMVEVLSRTFSPIIGQMIIYFNFPTMYLCEIFISVMLLILLLID